MNAAERDFWRLFFLESKTGIWMATLKRSMPVNMPIVRQYMHVSRHAFLSRCNKSFALMCGCRNPDDLIGAPLPHIFPPAHHASEDILPQFIHRGCGMIREAVSSEVTGSGGTGRFENTLIGTVRKGRLTGIWGFRQTLTEERQMILQRRTLLDLLTPNQRVILKMTVHGKTLKEIGDVMSLSINTVESYRMRALSKLNLPSVTQLIRHAVLLGLDGESESKEKAWSTMHTLLSR